MEIMIKYFLKKNLKYKGNHERSHNMVEQATPYVSKVHQHCATPHVGWPTVRGRLSRTCSPRFDRPSSMPSTHTNVIAPLPTQTPPMNKGRTPDKIGGWGGGARPTAPETARHLPRPRPC